jgi:EAL domain-containing protein (putative c-di-GMP-specific phosphodiesterase class I)
LRDQRAIHHDLHFALERGEISLEYQPQMNMDRSLIGFEALVRWRHPVHGLISPAVFIPLAERGGLIFPIGEWILRAACREAASWSKPWLISVNCAPLQFRQGNLVKLVASVLAETGLAANRLELEITEGALVGDRAHAIAILKDLKGLGVRIAIDDFGIGYSSLSRLKDLPVDKIKIDRAFVADLHCDRDSASITRAIIALGHALGLTVVAEGVETEEQLAILAREACDQVQGFLLGRPQPIECYLGAAAQGRRKGRSSGRKA